MSLEDYFLKNSNQYHVHIFLYNFLIDHNMFTSFGKKQYRKEKLNFNKAINEVYKKLNIDLFKYKSFIDICSNPNQHTLYILSNNKLISGKGLSLHIKKGGYPSDKKIELYKDRFDVTDFDLLNDKLTDLNFPVSDYALSDCFVRHNINVRDEHIQKINLLLQLNSLKVLSNFLKNNGDALILLPFIYNPVFLLNMLFLFKKMFNDIVLFKSEIFVPNLAVVWVYCIGFDRNFDRSYFKDLVSDKNIFDAEFMMKHISDIEYIYSKINLGLIKSIKKKHISDSNVVIPDK